MDVNYQRTSELFTSFADDLCVRNFQKLETLPMSTYLHMAESMLNYQYKIASIYIPRAIYLVGYEHGLLPILFSAFHKNIFAFYSAIELTKKGLFGPARPLLRYISEGLIIAKYCSVNPDINLIQKWGEGEYINLSREVLAKIVVPDTRPLKDFWGILHSYVHSTKYAQQVSLSLDNNLY